MAEREFSSDSKMKEKANSGTEKRGEETVQAGFLEDSEKKGRGD